MNRAEAYDIEKRYGTEAYHLALSILEKQRIIQTHQTEINIRNFHIKNNEEKIRKLKEKLVKVMEAKKC